MRLVERHIVKDNRFEDDGQRRWIQEDLEAAGNKRYF